MAELFLANERWLMERILQYAREFDYTRYTSTLVDAWRMSIEGLNTSLCQGMVKYPDVPEFGPEESFSADPLTRFGIIEAERHRKRGVSLTMFLGLMKYYRQSYQDLLGEKMPAGENRDQFRRFVDRSFDRMEIAFCAAWKNVGEDDEFQQLQHASREITNEKNIYLTLLESLEGAVIVIDDARLVAFNSKANDLIDGECREAFEHHRRQHAHETGSHANLQHWWSTRNDTGGLVLDRVFPWARPFLERKVNEDTIAILQNEVVRYFDVRRSVMQDVSRKYSGTVLTLADVTHRERFKATIQSVVTAHREMNHLGVEALLPWLLQQAATHCESRLAICLLFGETTDEISVFLYDRNTQPPDDGLAGTPLSREHYETVLQKIMGSPRVILNDASILKDVWIPGLREPLTHLISTAIAEDGQPRLAFCVANRAVPFDESDLDQLHFLSENAWNIIARKRAERDLDQRKQEVERLKRAESLAVLAGGVAHDFNNILSVISSHGRLIGRRLDTGCNPQIRQSVDAIQKAVEKGEEVTKTMRACTGTSLGRVTEEVLGQMIESWLLQQRPKLPENIVVSTDISPDLPAVKLDASQFTIVLFNLMENAIEAIGDRAGKISVRVCAGISDPDESLRWTGTPLPAGEPVVCLTMADNGMGMSPRTLVSAFDPFFTTRFVGRGLGLAAVRGLVIAHGGRVRIESAEGMGTSVHIELPVAERNSNPPERLHGKQRVFNPSGDD